MIKYISLLPLCGRLRIGTSCGAVVVLQHGRRRRRRQAALRTAGAKQTGAADAQARTVRRLLVMVNRLKVATLRQLAR